MPDFRGPQGVWTVNPAAEQQSTLQQARCRDAWAWDAHAVPERTERLHLTLHFLGAVPQRRLPELIDGLRVSFSAFTLHLDRAQCWSNGIAVLTPQAVPQAVPQALLALHAALRVGLERLDQATETRRWRPHLTLARHASGSAAPAKAAPVHWPVRGVGAGLNLSSFSRSERACSC